MEADIRRQHRAERLHVAAARRGEECLGKFEAASFLQLEARSLLADMGAGSGRERQADEAGPTPAKGKGFRARIEISL